MEDGGGEGEEEEARKVHEMRMRMRWVERRRNDKAPPVAVPCWISCWGYFFCKGAVMAPAGTLSAGTSFQRDPRSPVAGSTGPP